MCGVVCVSFFFFVLSVCNCSSVCLLIDFSHGATSFSRKVNIMPISGKECSQLITLQKMDTKELHL